MGAPITRVEPIAETGTARSARWTRQHRKTQQKGMARSAGEEHSTWQAQRTGVTPVAAGQQGGGSVRDRLRDSADSGKRDLIPNEYLDLQISMNGDVTVPVI